MKSIKRNKLLIEGFPADQIAEIGLQQHCKDRVCVVLWSFMIRYYQEALLAVLSETLAEEKCKSCQQIVRTGKWDGEFFALMQSSSVIVVTCNSLEEAIHIRLNLEEERKKTGLVHGNGQRQATDECYRTSEVWHNGVMTCPTAAPEKQSK